MLFLQQIYIWILNPIYNITGKISNKTRNGILWLCLFAMSSQMFLFTTWEKFHIDFGYGKLFMVNTFLLGLIIIFSVNKPLIKVKWNPFIYIPWFLCAAFIIASGFHHNITGALMFFAAMMAIVFPCLYFVWNNRGDYYILYEIACKSIVVMVYIFFIFHLLTVPVYNPLEAYQGIAVNPNSIGLIGTGGAIASLYLICDVKNKRLIYIVSYGMSVTLAYMAVSRASIIAIGIATIVFLICYFRSSLNRGEAKKKSFIVIVSLIIITAVSVGGYKYVFMNYTPAISHQIRSCVNTTFHIDKEKKLHSEKQIKGDQPKQHPGAPLTHKFNKGKDLNSLSSGRLVIWKNYIGELNLIGHERGDKGLYVPERNANVSAHNSYLEIGYRSGIFAGIAYGLVALFAAFYAFRFLFTKKYFDYRLSLMPMAVMAFGILSNLERALYPVEKVHIFLFFLVLAPMFLKSEMTKDEETNPETNLEISSTIE